MAKRSCFCCLDEFDVLDLMCCDNNDEHSLCIPCFSAQLSGQCNGNVNQFLSCSGLNCNFRYSILHLFEIEDREVWSKVWRYSIQVTLNRWEAMLVEYVLAPFGFRPHNAVMEAMIFRCPKCKTPFMTSVEGACAALSCCKLHFCGLCMHLSNTGIANHEHVLQCGKKNSYYFTKKEYQEKQIPEKKKRVLHVINGLSENDKRNMMNRSTTDALISALETINLSLEEAGLEGYVNENIHDNENLLSRLDSSFFKSCITFVAKSLESFAQQPFGILLILVFQLIKPALASLYRCVNHPYCRKLMMFLSKLRPPLSKDTIGWTVCLILVVTTELCSFLFLISVLLIIFVGTVVQTSVYGKMVQTSFYVLDKIKELACWIRSLRPNRSWDRIGEGLSQLNSKMDLVCWATGFVVITEYMLTEDSLVLREIVVLFLILLSKQLPLFLFCATPVRLTILVYGKVVQASLGVIDKTDQLAQRLQSLRPIRSWLRTARAPLMEHSQSISNESLVRWTTGFVAAVAFVQWKLTGDTLVLAVLWMLFLVLISVLLTIFVYGKIVQASSYVLDKTDQFAQRLQRLRQYRSWGRTMKAQLMEYSQSISSKSLVCWTTGLIAGLRLFYNDFPLLIMMIYFLPSLHATHRFISELNH